MCDLLGRVPDSPHRPVCMQPAAAPQQPHGAPARGQQPPDVSGRLTLEDKKYTRLCEDYLQGGRCSRAVCHFAHSHEQQHEARCAAVWASSNNHLPGCMHG
jgi:hypothetical protein